MIHVHVLLTSTCMLLQALKKLRYSGLQPYVIFVASPRLERLQFTRQIVSEKGKKSFGGAFSWSSTHEEFMYTVSILSHDLYWLHITVVLRVN